MVKYEVINKQKQKNKNKKQKQKQTKKNDTNIIQSQDSCTMERRFHRKQIWKQTNKQTNKQKAFWKRLAVYNMKLWRNNLWSIVVSLFTVRAYLCNL